MLFNHIGVRLERSDTYPDILDRQAMEFLAEMSRQFRPRVKELLDNRKSRQEKYDSGQLPSYDNTTLNIRTDDWVAAPIPEDIRDRRVEITGPPERKMVINALNSGANVFMADFEDSMSPTWVNALEGQRNLRDAVRKRITYQHPTKGLYKLNAEHAVLFVRPRGLHLEESHFLVDNLAIPASFFDFGLHFYHNAKELVDRGSGPYFYLPKLEHYAEARLWNDIFNWSQDYMNIPRGTIRATVLLETLPAAFQMDEILYELKDHSAGLNCGRWDYIFSYIKTLRAHPDRITPDRAEIGMTAHFMNSYSKRVIQVCHRRGVHAMGGMAAQIPIRGDDNANHLALERVREDKRREVLDGHDGTWVAHPGLVSLAKDIFDEYMRDCNQIGKETSYKISEEDLLVMPSGDITREGLLQNIDVGIRYIHAWISGNGCVPLYNLMEDAATAEISRTQVWQWVRHGAEMSNGTKIDHDLVTSLIAEWKAGQESSELLDTAVEIFQNLSTSGTLEDFLTIPAYEYLTTN